jgi:lysophospholipase L1-like esterase
MNGGRFARTASAAFLAAGLLCFGLALLRKFDLPSFAVAGLVLLVVGIVLARVSGWRPRVEMASMALFILSAAGALALAEGVVRLSGVVPPPALEYYQPHPSAIFAHTPGLDAEARVIPTVGRESTSHVRTSPSGLRGEDPPMPKPEGEFRVLLLGDSYTFGWGVEEEETIDAHFKPLFEEYFESFGEEKSTRIINGGVGGTAPWQALRYLEDSWQHFDIDCVILQTFVANDVSDTLLRDNRVPRAYAPEWVEQVNSYRYHDDWRIQINRALARHSRLYALVEERVTGRWTFLRAANQLRFIEPLRLVPDTPPEPYAGIYEVDRVDSDAILDAGFEALAKDIRAIAAFCEERGWPFAVYNVPWPADPALFNPLGDDLTGYEFEMDRGSRRMEAMFEQGGYDWIPMIDAFRAHPDPAALMFSHDGHLTPAGCRFVAERFAEAVKYRRSLDSTW